MLSLLRTRDFNRQVLEVPDAKKKKFFAKTFVDTRITQNNILDYLNMCSIVQIYMYVRLRVKNLIFEGT